MTPDADSRLNEALTHAQFVRAVARGVLGGDADVEDVLQETFLVAWTRAPRKPGALRAWIGTVAKRLALDRLRSGGRRRRREAAAARPEALPSVATIAAREETRRLLLDAVLALDEPYRATLLWRYHAGLSLAEIAVRQGVPEETVHTRIRRGLSRLRERLDHEHPGGRAAWIAALVPLSEGTEGGPAPVEGAPLPRGVGASALATAGALVGGLVVKKVVVTAGVVALLVAGGVVLVRALGPVSGDAPAEPPPRVAEVAPVAGGSASPSLAAEGRTARPPATQGAPTSTTSASLGRLHVLVLGPDGQTIEGATVAIAPGVETLPSRNYQQVAGTKTAATDASGVTFEVPPGRHAVRVRAPNLRPIDLEPFEVVTDQMVARVARLDEGIVVTLRVLDQVTREPVARAKVHFGGPLDCVAEGATDAEGRCTLRGFAPPTTESLRADDAYWVGRLFVRVFAEGFVPFDWSVESPKFVGPVSYELNVRRGTTVRVRVSTSDGSVPPDVQVSVPMPQTAANPISRCYPVVAPGPDGWAVLPPLAPGHPTIHIRAGGEGVRYEGIEKIVEVGTAPVDVEVTLRRVADVLLEGRVLLPDGRPAPAVAVMFVAGGSESGAWSVPEAVTDGRFVKDLVGVGSGTLHVYVPGYLRQSFPVEISPTPGEPLTLTLREGPRLSGQVVDRSGHPVAGVTVGTWKEISYANGSKSVTSLGEVTTGDDGRFAFVAVDGTPTRLVARSARWIPIGSLTAEESVVPGREVTIVVKPASEGQGYPVLLRVLEPRGKALEGQVKLWWESGQGRRGAAPPTILPDGRFRFGFWGEPGTYDLDVFVPGYRVARLRAVRVEDTATPETHDVHLDLGGVVRLRILSADGQPWARHSFQAGEQLRLVSTDDAGVIELTGYDPGIVERVRVVDAEDTSGHTNAILKNVQAPGSYDAVVQRSGYVTAKLPWTYDEIPAGAVSELLDAEGRVVDRTALVRHPGAGNRRPAGTHHRIVADGAYTVRVTSGTLRLTGTGMGRLGQDVEVPLAP